MDSEKSGEGKAKDLYVQGLEYEQKGDYAKAIEVFKQAIAHGSSKAYRRLEVVERAYAKAKKDDKWDESADYEPIEVDESKFDKAWLADIWTKIYNLNPFSHVPRTKMKQPGFRLDPKRPGIYLDATGLEDESLAIDWWGVYIIRLKYDKKARIYAVIDKPKGSRLDPNRETLLIYPPYYGHLDLHFIDPMSFEYRYTTAGERMWMKETETARVPIGSVVILKTSREVRADEYEFTFFYLLAHHTGLVPIKKMHAEEVLAKQLVQYVRFRERFPPGCTFKGRYTKGKVDISFYPERTGEIYTRDLEFTLKIQPEMLDEETLPFF
jgi:tetratricopeptide (TPR) repeat protein